MDLNRKKINQRLADQITTKSVVFVFVSILFKQTSNTVQAKHKRIESKDTYSRYLSGWYVHQKSIHYWIHFRSIRKLKILHCVKHKFSSFKFNEHNTMRHAWKNGKRTQPSDRSIVFTTWTLSETTKIIGNSPSNLFRNFCSFVLGLSCPCFELKWKWVLTRRYYNK